MKTARRGSSPSPSTTQVLLEALQLAAEGVAAAEVVGQPEVVAVADDHPGAAPEDRPPFAVEGANRLVQALALHPHRDRGRLAAWDHQAVEASSPARSRTSLDLARRATRASGDGPRSRPGWRGRRCAGEARLNSGAAALQQAAVLGERLDLKAGHRVAELHGGLGDPLGVVEVGRRLDDRTGAPVAGSSLLKIPEPTKLPSAPSCIISAASAGVAMPPAQKSGTGSQPRSATSWTTSSGAWCSLAAPASCSAPQRGELLDAVGDLAHVADRLDDVAGAGLALGADHRRALADAAERLAEVGGAANERAPRRRTCRCGSTRRPGSGPRTRRCSRPRATGAPGPRRSGRSGPWPSPGSSPPPGSP